MHGSSCVRTQGSVVMQETACRDGILFAVMRGVSHKEEENREEIHRSPLRGQLPPPLPMRSKNAENKVRYKQMFAIVDKKRTCAQPIVLGLCPKTKYHPLL